MVQRRAAKLEEKLKTYWKAQRWNHYPKPVLSYGAVGLVGVPDTKN